MADDPPAKRGMGAHWADTNMIESNCFKCFSFRWIPRPMSRFLIVFSNFLPLYEEGSCLSTYPHRISDCSYSLASRWVLGGGGGLISAWCCVSVWCRIWTFFGRLLEFRCFLFKVEKEIGERIGSSTRPQVIPYFLRRSWPTLLLNPFFLLFDGNFFSSFKVDLAIGDGKILRKGEFHYRSLLNQTKKC
jgi:hypothetical protein